jgi:hypothetical protein
VTAVVVLGVPGQKLPHDGGDALCAASKKEVDVVAHKDPGVGKAMAFGNVLPVRRSRHRTLSWSSLKMADLLIPRTMT